jgi:DNA-binding transcriptional MerR regulator
MASGQFTLSELARAARMSVGDVRLYRDRGLLPPVRRRRGRSDYHTFQVEHVDRLRLIGRALRYGFSLEDIAKMVDDHGMVTCNDIYRIAFHRLETLRRDPNSDDATVGALTKLTATCARTGGRRDCQIFAALSRVE